MISPSQTKKPLRLNESKFSDKIKLKNIAKIHKPAWNTCPTRYLTASKFFIPLKSIIFFLCNRKKSKVFNEKLCFFLRLVAIDGFCSLRWGCLFGMLHATCQFWFFHKIFYIRAFQFAFTLSSFQKLLFFCEIGLNIQISQFFQFITWNHTFLWSFLMFKPRLHCAQHISLKFKKNIFSNKIHLKIYGNTFFDCSCSLQYTTWNTYIIEENPEKLNFTTENYNSSKN